MIEGYLLSIHNANRIEQLNPFSYTFTLFTLVQYNDFMRLSSTIQFIHLIVWIQSLPIYRVIKYNIFLFWTLNQTRFCQFGSSISHKFLIFILNINHTKDWNMLAKPIWVVMKWWKRVNRWLDPKSMNDQRMMVWDLEQTEKQSKHWIFNDHWTKWSGMEWMCRSNDGITNGIWHDQREWKKHLWMKSNQSNNTRNWFR